ncbi:uncharacterized protein LOC119082252 [Bradysia coprophila]|uniref:uncharacterized protein LOC119082252 n=1 Tax=Bradysia coprophila TaxID=38358 RepID=UPI00187D8A0B|nr:uncharacterized protein LOC119082252 [Bradysia coprophila]
MLNNYERGKVFEISTETVVPSAVVNAPASPCPQTVNFPPIYEDPDKFFIYFLGKDLVNYFKHQTQIICKPTGAELIELYHVSKTSSLDVLHKKTIIQISANHCMLVKHNEPSVADRVIWARVVCDVFRQFRDSNTDEYYFAVYNPQKGDGFLGNRIKLLMKHSKKVKENQASVNKQIDSVEESSIQENEEDPINSDLHSLVDFMKIADITTDKSIILENHKKTFSIRQLYRKQKDIVKLTSEFPRFFDVDGLIDEDYAQLYPLSGLVTYTQEIQQKIVSIAKESKNYGKFPLTHKNLPQPLNALLHLIVLLPPTSLGRGQKNRVKLELAFPRLVKVHEVNQPLIDLTKDNPESSPFIVVSGSNHYVVYDNHFVTCSTSFSAIDTFFKVHFVFPSNFDSNIRHVLAFVGHYFYNMKSLRPTSEMRLLSTRLFAS